MCRAAGGTVRIGEMIDGFYRYDRAGFVIAFVALASYLSSDTANTADAITNSAVSDRYADSEVCYALIDPAAFRKFPDEFMTMRYSENSDAHRGDSCFNM